MTPKKSNSKKNKQKNFKPKLTTQQDILGIKQGEGNISFVMTNDEFEKRLKDSKDEIIKIVQDAKTQIDNQIQTDKATLISVFGIFASIISLLTIEFQFFKTIFGLQDILGFSLVLFAQLFSFNIALDYLVKTRSDQKDPKPNGYFCVFVGVLFVLGVGLLTWNK